MSTYIKFNVLAAQAAGMEVTGLARGTEEQIGKAEATGDIEYLLFLLDPAEFGTATGEIEGIDFAFVIQFNSAIGTVCANSWGDLRAPLIKFLAANKISWQET